MKDNKMHTIKFISTQQVALFKDIMGPLGIFVPKIEIGQRMHFELVTDRAQILDYIHKEIITYAVWYDDNRLKSYQMTGDAMGSNASKFIPDAAIVVFYPVPYLSNPGAEFGTEIMYRYIPITELRKMELQRESLLACNEMVGFLRSIGLVDPNQYPMKYTEQPTTDIPKACYTNTHPETQPLNDKTSEIPTHSLSESELNKLADFANRKLGADALTGLDEDALTRLDEFVSRDLGTVVDDHELRYYLLRLLYLSDNKLLKKKDTR